MARSSINVDSLEYLKITVTPPAGIFLTTQPVSMAVVTPNVQPVVADWAAAEWAEQNTARLLFGPEQNSLSAGVYNVWIKITDSPEIPVMKAGTITVTEGN